MLIDLYSWLLGQRRQASLSEAEEEEEEGKEGHGLLISHSLIAS